MTPLQTYYDNLAATMIKKMEKRGFDAYYCPDSKSAVEKVLALMPKGSSVSWGGSMTLEETGLQDALTCTDYRLIDRDKAANPAEKKALQRQAFYADFYLMSANAITKDGILVNIDGNGNRVAALAWGPEHVLILAGMNKVEPNLEAAIARVRHTAAPANALRLNLHTPCSQTGVCADCLGPDCICSQTVITRFNRNKGRIKVLLIGENLGY